jgi:hypothetical protein
MIDYLCFLIRYIPFWAIPTLFITAEFGYRYWLKRKSRVFFSFFLIFCSCLTLLGFYYWAGGPEKSVEVFLKYVFYD